MPNTPQAHKRVRQNEKAYDRNKSIRSEYRTAVKGVLRALKDGKVDDAKSLISKVESKVDRAAKRKVIHQGKADRIKARLKIRVSAAASA